MPRRSGAVKSQHPGEVVQADTARLGTFQARSQHRHPGIQSGCRPRAGKHRGTHHNHAQRTGNFHQQVNTPSTPMQIKDLFHNGNK